MPRGPVCQCRNILNMERYCIVKDGKFKYITCTRYYININVINLIVMVRNKKNKKAL